MEFGIFLELVLREAVEIANANFGKVAGHTKPEDNNQVLTATDLEIGKRLIKLIEGKYPEHNIIDEEAGVIDKGSAFTWVVDPIDGTSNFAQGIPTYGIMLGLLHGDKPLAGGIALPAFGQIYLAEKNQGAWMNGQKLSISQEVDLKNVLVAYGIDGHQENPERTHKEMILLEKLVLAIRNLRTSNSAFDAAMVAAGRYGGMLNQTSKIWDNVAQQILVEEAGGMYTDFWGKPMVYDNPVARAGENFTYCAAAPELHSQIRAVLITYERPVVYDRTFS